MLPGNTLHFDADQPFSEATVTVTGPDGYRFTRELAGGTEITVALDSDLADGRYKYRIRLDPVDTGQRHRFVDNLFFVQEGQAVSRSAQRRQIGAFKERLKKQQDQAFAASQTLRANQRKYPFAYEGGGQSVAPPTGGGDGPGGTVPYYTFPYTTFPQGLCAGSFCPDYSYVPPDPADGISYYPRVRNPFFAGFSFSNVPYGPFAQSEGARSQGGDGPGGYGYASTWYVGAFGPAFIISGYPYYGYYPPAQGDGTGYSYPFILDAYSGNLALSGRSYLDGGGYGYGIEAPLTVVRSDGSSSVLILNGGSSGRSQMLNIESDGPVEMTMTDSAKDITWKVGTRGNNFEISNGGSGQTEVLVSKNGDLTISGTLAQGSSREIKENFEAVDGVKMLEQVLQLPLLRWNYKERPPEDAHFGPMAEDFHASFGLGMSDKSLAPSDAAGVALAAIQGLHVELEKRDAEILRLQRQLHEVVTRLEKLTEASGEP